jgi:hypothetical protein
MKKLLKRKKEKQKLESLKVNLELMSKDNQLLWFKANQLRLTKVILKLTPLQVNLTRMPKANPFINNPVATRTEEMKRHKKCWIQTW